VISIPKTVKNQSFKDYQVDEEASKKNAIVDTKGNPIKLSPRQKNEIYRKAKEMREKIKDSLLTKSECWNPSDKNVQKMLKREFPMGQMVDSFRNHMRAIGADPRDISTERMRRAR